MTSSSSNAKPGSLLAKYSIAAASESVKRLAALIAVRGADLDKVAKVIAADPLLTAELLEGDVPASGALDEVERQIFRRGVEPILVMALSEPLTSAVFRTFDSMVGFTLQPVPVGKANPSAVERFTSSLSVTGRANGKVYLRLGEDFCRSVAAKILGLEADELSPTDLTDVLAELSNVIVGNFQSNLCDASLGCKLSVPEVVADAVFSPPKVPRGNHRTFGFRHDSGLLLVDILVEFAG
jgi:CheY-specific phosphatase CheX